MAAHRRSSLHRSRRPSRALVARTRGNLPPRADSGDVTSSGTGGPPRRHEVLLQLPCELLSFGADFVDELGVRRELLPERYAPWPGVCLGIIDGDLDLEVAEVRPSNPFAQMSEGIQSPPVTSR